jgi:probable phosphoglycerate mutase
MSKTILFIRHAESAANAGLATASPDSIPLTEKGVEQSKLLADFLHDDPQSIVVSSFLRAKQTAAPLIERFAGSEIETWDVHEFTYLSQKRCGHSSMADRKPLVDEFWQKSDPDYCDGRGAESFADFIQRVRETVQRLENSQHQTIAVVTHGQFIRAAEIFILVRYLIKKSTCPGADHQ